MLTLIEVVDDDLSRGEWLYFNCRLRKFMGRIPKKQGLFDTDALWIAQSARMLEGRIFCQPSNATIQPAEFTPPVFLFEPSLVTT